MHPKEPKSPWIDNNVVFFFTVTNSIKHHESFQAVFSYMKKQ